MPDISMCQNSFCPSAMKCYRYRADCNPNYQTYANFSPGDKKKCDYFIKYIEESKIIKNVVILTDSKFNLDNFSQIKNGFLTLGFQVKGSYDIIGEYSKIRRKDNTLLTTLKFYKWKEVYSLLTPAVGLLVEDYLVSSEQNSKRILKFKITSLALVQYNEDTSIPRLSAYLK